MTVDVVLCGTRCLLRLSPRTTCQARRTGNDSWGPGCGDGEKACLMHSFLLLGRADKRLLRSHDCLSSAPPFFIIDLVTSANGATEGRQGSDSSYQQSLAMALQTRPQQVGTVGPALRPLKMDFNPGHRKPGSQRLGVKPQRGSTVAAPPAVHGQSPAAVSPAGLANSY